MYIRAAAKLAQNRQIPLRVADNGAVAALAGAMALKVNREPVLGLCMDSGLSCGYIGADGTINDWLNQIAFAPLDGNPDAPADEWSGDRGCGVKYLSQASAIRLAGLAGIELPEGAPREQVEFLMGLLDEDNANARKIFENIGCYLGHALALYRGIYTDAKHVALSGLLAQGKSGEIIVEEAMAALKADYPKLAASYELHLPTGQELETSIAAAALPIAT